MHLDAEEVLEFAKILHLILSLQCFLDAIDTAHGFAKEWGVGEGLNPNLGTPFYADSNELCFVSIVLILTERLVDCDRT